MDRLLSWEEGKEKKAVLKYRAGAAVLGRSIIQEC